MEVTLRNYKKSQEGKNSALLKNQYDNRNCGKGNRENAAPKNHTLNPKILSALRLYSRIRVLELQCGQGMHMASIVTYLKDIRYFGLDSDTRKIKDCQVEHEFYMDQRKALFQCHHGEKIPYVAQFFHRILCWDPSILGTDPKYFLMECHRVLAGEGILTLVLERKDENSLWDWEKAAKKIGFRCLGTEAIQNSSEEEGLGKGYLMVALKKPLLSKIIKEELVFRKRS